MLESLIAFLANGRKGVRFALAMLLALVIASASQPANGAAVTVVNWGGDYVASNRLLNLGGPINSTGQYGGQIGVPDTRFYRPFRDDAPAYCLSPTSAYSGKPFYGGLDFYNYDSTITSPSPLTRNNVFNFGSTDYISVKFKATMSGAGALAVVFLKQDFIALQDKPNIYMDADDATISITSQLLAPYLAGRFILRNGSTYYLSEYTFGANAPGEPITLANPSTSTRWAAYDPTTSLLFNPTSFNYIQFNDVTAAGYYVFSNNLPAGVEQETSTVQFGLKASDIATVAPVPLPMAFWAGTALLAGIAARHIRRRRLQGS